MRRAVALAMLFSTALAACQSNEERADELFEHAMGLTSTDSAGALELFRQVLELDGTCTEAREEVAVIHLADENYSDARSAADRAVSDAVIATPRALETLGRAEAALEHWDEAAAALRRAIQTEPDRTYLLVEIAAAADAAGDLEQALASYREAVEADVETAASTLAIARLMVDRFAGEVSGQEFESGLPDELLALQQEVQVSLDTATAEGLPADLETELAALTSRFEQLVPEEPEELARVVVRAYSPRRRLPVSQVQGGLIGVLGGPDELRELIESTEGASIGYNGSTLWDDLPGSSAP